MNGLSAQGLADLAGVTEAEVRRLVDLGILVARDGAGPFLETDVQKVRLATACEQAGLPMDGIAAAVQLRCWSRPMTTTRLPFDSDCAACSAWSRQTITVKNDASCSRFPEMATRNIARAIPASV